jgi:hypothetical protein
MAEEELDEDLILALLRDLDVPIPDEEVVREFDATWTPLQVARLVARCRRADLRQGQTVADCRDRLPRRSC